MFRDMKLKFICLSVAFSILGGGPLAMYQVFAWSQMLHNRIPDQGLVKALDSTFSGEAPCEYCKAIAAIKAEEKKPYNDKIPSKRDLMLDTKISSKYSRLTVVKPAGFRLGYHYPFVHTPESRSDRCPVPPPRLSRPC